MTTIIDFTNQLHIRLHVAEVLKEYVDKEDFCEIAERMFQFIIKGSNLPLQPVKDNTMQELMGNWVQIINGSYFNNNLRKEEDKSNLEKLYDEYRNRPAHDPTNKMKQGIIVGYSNEFNSLIAQMSPSSPKGIKIGDSDFVNNTLGYAQDNGYFYITEEEIKKQYE